MHAHLIAYHYYRAAMWMRTSHPARSKLCTIHFELTKRYLSTLKR